MKFHSYITIFDNYEYKIIWTILFIVFFHMTIDSQYMCFHYLILYMYLHCMEATLA